MVGIKEPRFGMRSTAATLDIEGAQLNQRLLLTWVDVPQLVFGNMNAILDDQISPARRQTAKQLLQRYTGLYQGTMPLTQLG